MNHRHVHRSCPHVLRCLGCDAPIARHRDGESKAVMIRCPYCGTFQQRDFEWSSPAAVA